MRIKNLDVGVERITLWNVEDEVHLPPEGKAAPAFLPQYRPLDAILQRPSLDERLPDLLEPRSLDPGLLEPSALTEVRRDLTNGFAVLAARAKGRDQAIFQSAADLLGTDDRLDDEVRAALALLLRG